MLRSIQTSVLAAVLYFCSGVYAQVEEAPFPKSLIDAALDRTNHTVSYDGSYFSIDHRRVPNLQTYFSRHGEVLPVTDQSRDYQPGDLVTWMLPGNLPHIGIVVDRVSSDGKRYLIVHNVGQGPKLEDVLFDYEITGHYRYAGQAPVPEAH